MSRGFDEVVGASWGRFEDRLLARMRASEDGYFEIDQAERDEENLALVGIGWDDELIEADLVGLSDLPDSEVLRALGWEPPDNPEEYPFWGVVLSPDELGVLPGMVSGALRFAYGVADPVFLSDLEAGTATPSPAPPAEEVEDDEVSDDGATMGFADSHEELVGMVERSLARVYGSAVIRDDDGDFPINTGVVPLWVQVQEDTPIVRVFSYVVRSVRDIRQARIEVGILNRRTSLLKFTLEDGVIAASYEVPAVPFMGPQLAYLLDSITEILNDLAADAAVRVGGKLWFDGIEGASSTDVEETA